MSKMGISTIQSYRGAQIFEAIGLNEEFVDQLLRQDRRRGSAASAWRRSPRETLYHHHRAYADREVGPALLEEGGQYQWRRDGEYHLFNPETVFRLQHATQAGPVRHLQEVHPAGRRAERAALHAPRPVRVQVRRARRRSRSRRSSRSSRSSSGSPPARCSYGSISGRGARDPGHRHEPARRQEQHRRRGRGPRAVQAPAQRRQQAQRDQAGGLGPVRRDQRVPGQRRRAPDQDGAGGQARRGGPAPRPQGLALDRQGPVLDAGRRPDQPAAAPRHLLDRGPGPAHPRPEERATRGRGSASSSWPRSASARSPRAWPRRTATSS